MEILGARVLHPDGHVGPAVVRIDSGVIAEVDDTVPARGGDLAGLTLLPGYVDLHCHGGGGGDYASCDPVSIERALAFHRSHGTTTTQASLVSASMEDLCAQVAALTPFVRSGRIHGVHLEGPWLAPGACGALNVQSFRLPDAASVDALLACADGVVSMVTIAPELPGALEAIGVLTAAGIHVAIGHTEATYDQARAAIGMGARVATHLCNAMPPMHHRDPGPVGALLADDHVTVEIICDTVHLHPDIVRVVIQAAGGRAALITDAIAAAGTSAAEVRIGGQDVVVEGGVARVREGAPQVVEGGVARVREGAPQVVEGGVARVREGAPQVVEGGVARVREGGALAGSLLTMEAAVRHAVLDCGIDLAHASAAASRAPARALGLFDRGLIAHSMRADLVAVDTDLTVRRVMHAGHWLDELPSVHSRA